MTPEPSTEISSLIRLLDDRDPFVTDRVSDHLVQLGTEAVPFLEIASRGENLTLKTRAQEILNRIAPRQLAEEFRRLTQSSSGEEINLEEGVFLIMKFGHPSANPEEVHRHLDQLAQELAPEIQVDSSEARNLERMVRFLFDEKGFRGNQENYSHPDNSYIDTVLQHKTGLPIALSVLCILIGQRLQLPIVGIGLPYHFIAKYNSLTNPVLFDPFHQGRLLTPEMCAKMVEGFGVKFEPHFLAPLSHREILVRMMQNLSIAYQKEGREEKVEALQEYAAILLGKK